jgi:two-component system response regulator WspF
MRIGIVNDMKIACEALRRAVTTGGGHVLAWIAHDGSEAIELTKRDRPDLILMDLIMPGINGVEATRRIMSDAPCGILVVTSTVSGNFSMVYEAMGHGALDAVETPSFGPNGELGGITPLLEKIARIEKMSEPRSGLRSTKPSTTEMPTLSTILRLPTLVLIGASTGGPRVIADLISKLPASLPASVIIAQHVDEAYAKGMACWMGQHAKLPVGLAVSGEIPEVGHVHVASSNAHLILGSNGKMRYTPEPAGWYCPSVDALFHSAARSWPIPGVAILLTGMGTDGAAGMVSLRKAGWLTIAQDSVSSVVWGMPKAAIEAGAVQRVLAPADILSAITSYFAQKKSPARTP